MIFLKKKGIMRKTTCHTEGRALPNFAGQNSGGQAFLSMALLIGGIIIATGILFAFLAASFIDSGYGLQASYIAEAAATAGVEDALLQLARNGAFSSPSGYTVNAGGNAATVTVSAPSSGLITVLSVATVSFRTRKITAVVSENPVNNQITLASWQEIQ
jgi:uncharacterized protein (UPF0333 family)